MVVIFFQVIGFGAIEVRTSHFYLILSLKLGAIGDLDHTCYLLFLTVNAKIVILIACVNGWKIDRNK